MKDLIFAKYHLAFAGLILSAAVAVMLVLGLMLRGERIANKNLRTDLAKEQTGHSVTRASLDRATIALTSFMADADAARLAAQEAAARQRARDDDLRGHPDRGDTLSAQIRAVRPPKPIAARQTPSLTQRGYSYGSSYYHALRTLTGVGGMRQPDRRTYH